MRGLVAAEDIYSKAGRRCLDRQAAHERGERGDARCYGGRVYGTWHELSISVGGRLKEDPKTLHYHQIEGKLDGAGARQVSGGAAIVSASIPVCGLGGR